MLSEGGPGDPSYGLLRAGSLFEKADRILGSERHLEIYRRLIGTRAWSLLKIGCVSRIAGKLC